MLTQLPEWKDFVVGDCSCVIYISVCGDKQYTTIRSLYDSTVSWYHNLSGYILVFYTQSLYSKFNLFDDCSTIATPTGGSDVILFIVLTLKGFLATKS